MRNEFFGDDRDLFKWSRVLDLADPDRQIIYVPMFRPDYRLSKHAANGIREDVRQFFREDRMKSIKNLAPDRIVIPNWEIYEDSGRVTYFEKVRTAIEDAPNTHRVIFVDPDTGMQPQNASSKHIRDGSVRAIWGWMRDGDTLVIYQHAPQDRRADWVTAKAEQLSGILQIPLGEVHKAPALDVCFYWSLKQTTLAHAARSAT